MCSFESLKMSIVFIIVVVVVVSFKEHVSTDIV